MWFNPMMKWMLRSPLHGMIDNSTLVIRYQGRKSGAVYETPVNYVQDGDNLLITSFRNRTWWRNLRGGAPVEVLLRAQEHHATAEAFIQDDEVVKYLRTLLGKAPRYARYFQVRLDSDGQPEPNDLARAASERVVIRVQLGA